MGRLRGSVYVIIKPETTCADQMKIGDLVIFYHSNGKPSGAVGVGKVASVSYPDEAQFDSRSKYYYPRATRENPIWMLVDIGYVKTFKRLVSIEEMRRHKELDKMVLLQKGSRLSITPVTEEEFIYIKTLGEKK